MDSSILKIYATGSQLVFTILLDKIAHDAHGATSIAATEEGMVI